MSAREILIVIGIFIFGSVALAISACVVAENQEIAARGYAQLSTLASGSCAGLAYLKQHAQQPILLKDFGKHQRELQRLEEDQARLQERAKITGSTTPCAS